MGRLSGESRDLLAEISISEATRQQTKPDQDVPQRQYAQIGGTQRRGALSVDFHGTIQLMHGFFSHRAVVAEAFDFEKTSVGLKADLPQSRQVTQPFADVKVASVVDGRFRAGSHLGYLGNLFEVLLDARVLVIHV